ncbi:hypothetical protein ABZ890_12095 [Streptomyces sp. NPDC046984]|uniref:hypothetical protein n=1 Tax=Streptomyces sp. NPDC046984 TaxID=3155138 RepID=UPI00340334E9
MPRNAEIQALIRALVDQDFKVETHTGRSASRCKVTSPTGRVAYIPAPGKRVKRRAVLNARAALRRIGAHV